jgi:transcriptional regulator with XRE-family HTH domain
VKDNSDIPLEANLFTENRLRVQKIFSVGYCVAVGSFGANLKRARLAAGFRKAKDFALALGVKPPVVSEWEHDKGGLPETPTLLRIAKATGTSVESLLVGVDPEYDHLLAEQYIRKPLRNTTPVPNDEAVEGTLEDGGVTDGTHAELPSDRVTLAITLRRLEHALEQLAPVGQILADARALRDAALKHAAAISVDASHGQAAGTHAAARPELRVSRTPHRASRATSRKARR